MEGVEDWIDVGVLGGAREKACSCILDQLQLLEETMVKSSVEGIAVINPRVDEGVNGFLEVSSGQELLEIWPGALPGKSSPLHYTSLLVEFESIIKNNIQFPR